MVDHIRIQLHDNNIVLCCWVCDGVCNTIVCIVDSMIIIDDDLCPYGCHCLCRLRLVVVVVDVLCLIMQIHHNK